MTHTNQFLLLTQLLNLIKSLCINYVPEEDQTQNIFKLITPNSGTDPNIVKILQWNIWHGGVHLGEIEGPKRIGELIGSSKADIITIQEGYGAQTGLAKTLGYHVYTRSPSDNLALLSRYPITEHTSNDYFKSNTATISLPNKKKVLIGDWWLRYASKHEYTGSRDKMLNDVILDFEYRKIKSDCERNILMLENRLIDLSRGKENIGELIGKATGLLKNLHETYIEADSEGKRRLISSIYPQKLTFDGTQHRTVRTNEAVRVLGALKAVFQGKKKGQTKQKFDLPTMVALIGESSTLFEHCETVVNFERTSKNMLEGRYRKKKL